MTLLTQNDTTLWEQVQLEDSGAFALLFDRYWDTLFSMAWRRLQNEALAKDIIQNIFIHTWEHRHQIQIESSLAPYLFTALKYSVARHIYKAAKKGMITLPLSVLDIPDDGPEPESDQKEFEKIQDAIKHEIASMPDRMREIFTLKREQELSVKEIAIRLSLSEQTVKNQLHIALKRLRVRLSSHALFLPFIL